VTDFEKGKISANGQSVVCGLQNGQSVVCGLQKCIHKEHL
jgi:hypothetical protein